MVSSDPYLNTGPLHQTEVEPDTVAWGSTVVATFQVGRYGGSPGGADNIGWATSTDGGTSWTHGFLPSLTKFSTPAGPWLRAVDPSLAYDASHGVWLAQSVGLLATPTGIQNDALVVNSSVDGATWSAPVAISKTDGPDKDWIACDNWSASPHFGNCYAVWSNEDDADLLQMSTSSDGGLTWSAPVATATSATAYDVQPVVQPNG